MTTPPGAVASNARQADREAGGGGDIFGRKYGPLPGWGWALLAGGGALAYFWWKKRQAAQAATTAATTTNVGSYTGFTSSNVATLQSEIQQLQGQLAATSKTTTSTGTPSGGPPTGTSTTSSTGTPTGGSSGGGSKTSTPVTTAPVVVVNPWQGPNLRGMTIPQAIQALAGYQGGQYKISNITLGGNNVTASQAGSHTIYSFTPYSNGAIRIGLN